MFILFIPIVLKVDIEWKKIIMIRIKGLNVFYPWASELTLLDFSDSIHRTGHSNSTYFTKLL